MSGVELIGLRKTYGDVHALAGVDLEIADGELLTILGPSGAGKSTILNLIAGLAFPTAGNITISGTDVTNIPAERRNVGVVFQNYALFPHLDVAANVGYPLRIRKTPKKLIRERVGFALGLVQLQAYGHRQISELSGGQQQRVALARALSFEPRLLLLDEPLGALDTKLREEVRLELLALQRRLGITTVLVTHDQDEALTLSDRIAIVKDGQIAQVGSPQDLYRHPANSFVANFLGSANLISGIREIGSKSLISDFGQEFYCDDSEVAGHVDAVVRPEDLEFVSPDGDSGFEVAVDELIYLGSVYRVYVSVIADPRIRLIVDIPKGGEMPKQGARMRLKQKQQAQAALVERST